MKGSNSSYFGNIKEALSSLLQGLRLSFRHFREASESRKPMGIEKSDYFDQQTGIVTLQYPKESLPVPDNGRYKLHNEIDDCIVCDKCAKICPVDCIEIEPVKSVEEIGKTSDGTPKRLYAAKFDIDMGKCCFCGLCTTVCPTECLTMTKVYDFSEYDSADHIFAFSEMSPLEILQKKQELEEYKKQKEAERTAKSASESSASVARPAAARPKAVPPIAARPKPATGKAAAEDKAERPAPKPAFKPKIKPASPKKDEPVEPGNAAATGSEQKGEKSEAAPKPRFRPKIKTAAKPQTAKDQQKEEDEKAASAKNSDNTSKEIENKASAGVRPKPVIKPKVKSSAKEGGAIGEGKERAEEKKPASKAARPVVKPKIKAKNKEEEGVPSEETKEPRPLVKPTGVPKKPSEEEKSKSDKQAERTTTAAKK